MAGSRTGIHWLHLAAMARFLPLALAAIFVAAPAAAQIREDVRQAARVLATAGIAGRFAEPRCHEEGATVVPHAVARFTGELVRPGADALIVDTGGLLAPHGVTRFANQAQPEQVASMIGELGYHALALGESDLSAPRPRTLTVAQALRTRGLAYIASNLVCEPGHPLCAVITDEGDVPVPFDVGIERASVLAMLSPTSLERVAPDRSEGLTLSPIAERLPEAVRAARAAGATLVLAVLDVGSAEAFAIARDLPADARPDLLLLARAGGEMLFARPATMVPAIVAPPPGSGVEVRVGRSDAFSVGFELIATPFDSTTIAPAVRRFAATVGPAYCERWGRPLAGGHLERDIDAEGMAELTGRIVQHFADADVAFLNVGAIDATFAPSDPHQLQASDLYIAIEFDEPLVMADLPASWLRAAFDQAAAHGVIHPGLTAEGEGVDGLRILGRPPVAGALYHVVTLRFLAEGGDDALPPLPRGTRWEVLEHEEDGAMRYESLRDVVLDALEVADGRDPRDAIPPAEDPPEWVLRGTLDGTFSGSTVDNSAGYDAALLATTPSVAMGLSVEVLGTATAPHWSWENRVSGSFRTQWAPSAEPGTAGAFIEAQDQIQLRTMGSYRGFRADPTAVYIPDVYVEAFVESELTRPDTRDFHWLLIRPTAGTRFPLLPELEVKLQVGIQVQALQEGAEGEFGAGGSVLLNRWAVFTDDARSLTAEGSADFFCADLGDQNRWQLRSQLRLALDLAGPLALTFGANLYMQDEAAQGVAFAFSATAGLRLYGVSRSVGP